MVFKVDVDAGQCSAQNMVANSLPIQHKIKSSCPVMSGSAHKSSREAVAITNGVCKGTRLRTRIRSVHMHPE